MAGYVNNKTKQDIFYLRFHIRHFVERRDHPWRRMRRAWIVYLTSSCVDDGP